MGLFSRIGLKNKFSPKGKKPTVQDFADLIDSQLNTIDDFNRIGLKEHNINTIYQKDDTCIYENKLFKALEPTSGEFNEEKWANINITGNLINKLGYYLIDGFYLALYPFSNEVEEVGTRNTFPDKIYKLPSLEDAVNLKKLYVNNNKIKELIIPESLVNIEEIIASNNDLTELIIPPTCVNINMIEVCNNNITNIKIYPNMINLQIINASTCKLSQDSVDDILKNLDDTGIENGQLMIQDGDNAIPTDGYDNVNFNNLISKGWTIYTN